MFVMLCLPIYKLCHFIFRDYNIGMAVFCGGHMGYIMYDVTHYSLHHIKLPEFMKEIKKNHLDHHYKNYDLGYGVTSKFWDYVLELICEKTLLVDFEDLQINLSR